MNAETTGTAVEAPPALHLTSVEAAYGRTAVLRGVSMTVPAGSVTALLGPNGAGKTTLLKAISGLLRPTAGTVKVGGHDVTALSPNRRTARGVCHVPEGRGIFKRLTVRENLVMQSAAGQESEAIERATGAFPVLGQRLHQQAGTMSGGEQQMLAMSRAYVSNPKLILVDEASLGLAPILVDEIFRFLEEVVRSEGVALLIVDQFIHRALDMADHAHVLRRGELVFSGTASQLAERDIFADYVGD